MSVLDDIKGALDRLEAERKTVICHPDDVEAIQKNVDDQLLGGIVNVMGSPFVSPGVAFIVPVMQKFSDIPAIRDL